jgi:hypothetical protein
MLSVAHRSRALLCSRDAFHAMPRNLRKALSLTAFLFLLAALLPIQKEIQSFYVSQNYYPDRLQARVVTFLRQPLALADLYGHATAYPLRTELDWESCALEFVIIVSIAAFSILVG